MSGGELTITTVGDTSMKTQVPPEKHRKVAHAHLKSDAVEFSASDWPHQTRTPRQGSTVTRYINGGTYDQLSQIFDKLSEGADKELLDSLRDMSFGTFGHLADNFGVHWFFHGEKSP